MNNRLSWIDQARGVALLLVVIGHLGIPYFGQYYTTVHLPLFFFLSGVTFSANRDLVPFLKGRAKRLLIPYVCLGIPLVLSSVVTRIVQGVTDPGAYWQVCVAFLLQRRQYTVWFLTCLFLASVLLWCLIRLLKNRPGRILGVCFGLSAVAVVYWELGGVALPWNLDAGLVALVFMALGYCTRQTGWLEEKKNFRSWPVFGAAALGYLICVTVNGFVFGKTLIWQRCRWALRR